MAVLASYSLFGGFPREMMTNRVVVRSKEDFMQILNRNNGKRSVFATVYSFLEMRHPRRCKYESAIVDKIFSDFDTNGSFKSIHSLNNYCSKNEYAHRITFTGGGYQAYVFTDVEPLQYKKGAIKNATESISEELGLEIDSCVVGDIARICRVPFTFNVKRQKWCIPVTQRMIEKGDKFIRSLASSQISVSNQEWLLGGRKRLSLKDYDYPARLNRLEFDGDLELDFKIPEDIVINIKCPAILEIANMGDPGHRQRYYLMLYLKEQGLTPGETISFLRSSLTPEKFHHVIYEERVIKHLFRRDDLLMPSKQQLIREGICRYDCKQCSLEDIYL